MEGGREGGTQDPFMKIDVTGLAMEQVDSEPEGAAFGTSATFSTSVPHHMLPLNHPMTGFEELLILNLPKNRRIAFTDFFPLHSLISVLERTVIYSFTSRKK